MNEIQICQNALLNPVVYTIEGFPTSAKVEGLPEGITATLSATHHIYNLTFHNDALNGEVYTLEILGLMYSLTTTKTLTPGRAGSTNVQLGKCKC